MNRKPFVAILFSALAVASLLPNTATAQPDDKKIKIGMAKSFFNDLHPAIIDIATAPFPKLLKDVAGFNGSLDHEQDAFGTAAQLAKGQLDFGVFHGHEFAWVQKKHPELVPLLVVVNRQHEVRAFVIVHQKSTFKTVADLRGKTIDVPEGGKEHCRIFLCRKCSDNANKLIPNFASLVKSKTPYGSMDQVARGKADAALVDTISLNFYKDAKKAVFENNLRVLEQSEVFPAAVIAYKKGALKEATIKQFSGALVNAHQNPAGKDMMQMWGIEGFEPVPANYSKSLEEVIKLYPSPR
jgi:ABC-type phosphate/phosphonate transport system substrate-binding protein